MVAMQLDQDRQAQSAVERVARLRGRLELVLQLAREASRLREPGTPDGERWRWECGNCDTPIKIDPVTDTYVKCAAPGCGSWGVSLRSVQEYPTRSVGELPAFIIPSAEEVSAVAGRLLELHDTAYLIPQATALLELLDLHKADGSGRCGSCADADWSGEWKGSRWPCLTVTALAAIEALA